MSQASVESLVTLLGTGQADPAHFARDYVDAQLAVEAEGWLVAATLVPQVAGVATVAAPASAIRVLACCADDTALSLETPRGLDSVSAQWRAQVGRPVAYLWAEEPDRVLRLWPIPTTTSAAESFPTGTPLGADFPTDSLVLLHTETPRDAPAWLDLLLACHVLALEFPRDAPSRDPEVTAAATALARLLTALLR